MFVPLLALFCFGFLTANANPVEQTKKRYDDFKVLQVVPTNVQTVKFLHNMMMTDITVDFWSEPSTVGSSVDLMVSPVDLERIIGELNQAGIAYSIIEDNVQLNVLDPMWKSLETPEQRIFNIDDFNTLDDINAWLNGLVSQCRPDVVCEVYSVGNSYEGRPLNVFKISKPVSGRKAYWLDATIHAREWIATATILKVINNLALGGDADAVRLVDSFDWYFMPVQNPDGYQFTWDEDRLWRKNRRPNSGSICIGTDLNRNFNFRWGHDGVSFNPCAETFCGESAGSEPETQATSAELVRLGSTLVSTITMHAYGNMWMFPWGNTVDYAGQVCERSSDHDELMRVSDLTANAIESTYSTTWLRGNSCEVIYATTGGTDDFSKGAAGVAYAFCPELRGNSFVIPASQIELSFQEFFNGIVVLTDSIPA